MAGAFTGYPEGHLYGYLLIRGIRLSVLEKGEKHMAFTALQEIVEKCKQEGKAFWQVVLEDDMQERNTEETVSLEQMKHIWEAILSAEEGYEGELSSSSGLSGGDGAKIAEYYRAQSGNALCCGLVSQAVCIAVRMAESNACMKRIVAAPTAGSCGVLPAVLVPLYREGKASEEQILQAMFTAAGIGQVIALRASISGAAGGCQAEIGSASAMAAGALTCLQGGSAEQIIHAAAIALKGLLGLVCDPVGGLVEVPCIKRNVIGAIQAMSSADLAMAGITSRIPPDQVIDAMREIGDKMDSSLKETAKGGLAATPAALSYVAVAGSQEQL